MNYLMIILSIIFVLLISLEAAEAGNGTTIDSEMKNVSVKTATFGLG